ncbi:beta-galactosidase [Shewanella gaetbuli]|uniref:Beta-galactosidase n=1 Tax=Shewanella gaetbuli TaxID=220752 RepID=A0A9X2CLZ2_9GAMM|nr:beta-galactosidase [Shewanella gaetbuli]MCL1143194.1 beta-galactosidase [Shewanella gaetbuli]
MTSDPIQLTHKPQKHTKGKLLLVSAILSCLYGCQNELDSSVTEKSTSEQINSTSNQDAAIVQTLYSFDHGSDLTEVTLNNAQSSVNADGLNIEFQSAETGYASVVFQPKKPWDWSSLEDFNIAFSMANKGKHSVQLYLDMTDIDGATYTRSLSVPISSTPETYYAKMSGHDLGTPEGDEKVELNFHSGLRSNPDTWESNEHQFTSLWGKKNLNLKGIAKISLSVKGVIFDKSVIIKDIKVRQNPEFDQEFLTNIVDKYGQNAKADFAGKVHNDQELISQRDTELATLTGQLQPERSKFNGWLNGPKLQGTGYFRAEKVNDKWSLVDPEGYLYFATGLDIIRLSNSSTMTGYDFEQQYIVQRAKDEVTPEDSQKLNRVSDQAISSRFKASDVRAGMFTWLPDYDEPLGKHFGYRRSAHSGPLKHGETYSFYAANLERKYGQQGQDYMQSWRDVTVDRMLDWGFTSLGNWTDPSYYDNNKIPYFANGWIIGDYKTVSSGNDFWAPLPDVFDPKFKQRAFATAQVVAEEVRNNPWCVGVFIDNEMSFGRSETTESRYGIVLHTLKRDAAEVPTKAEFSRLMKQKYVNIDALNKAWDKQIPSWKAFDEGIDSSINNKQQIADYADLLGAYAEKYFSTVNDALAEHMPNHMYLGSRFPDWGMPIEVVKASAKYVDVISFNSYKEGLNPKFWSFLDEIDMPSIVGEFHIGAKDSGLYHPGLIHAANQKDRAKMYQDYMKSVIDNPYFIGAHWFQYIDSPITGRAYDGENYNVGFVTVTDTPYPYMVEAAKQLHSEMYQQRFGKQ